jgi:hypothetical protein
MTLIDQFNFRNQSVWTYDPIIETTTKKMANIHTQQNWDSNQWFQLPSCWEKAVPYTPRH